MRELDHFKLLKKILLFKIDKYSSLSIFLQSYYQEFNTTYFILVKNFD